MKKQILFIGLGSLVTTAAAPELNLQLSWDDQAPITRLGSYSAPQATAELDSVEHIVTPAFQNAIHVEDASVAANPTFYFLK